MPQSLTRDELAALYFEQLPYPPYPVQEEALLAWFTSDQGVLVATPTGTGKTLIAEAALFEALHSGRRAYYTTPLIALTDQKHREMQQAAVSWGFRADDVGLVTGNRQVNGDAPVLVVVAEILFNRLLHSSAFHFDDVAAVVMDEFHSFNDPERGVVWEMTLGLLPRHIRLLLLSATVGNVQEFNSWMSRCHGRRLEVVVGDERRVPLTYQWVGDKLLAEQIEEMARGDEESRFTPALIFCFNREECWSVAEQLKGKKLIEPAGQKRLADELDRRELSRGAGPKLRALLLRGVGVHHAGMLPRFRRLVEELFQEKLLSVCVCTETLAAGINLPARSVVMPNLVKGPPKNRKLIDASSAHQIFGRAGRPQFDARGYVFALAHEDDVKILRWREKYDQIPDDTKDPKLRQAKKALKKKMPTRRTTETYWSEAQFEKLKGALPAKLHSRGPLPWRMLAYMLEASADLSFIRDLVGKRLMEAARIEAGQRELDRMLTVLWRAGYVTLEPPPPVGDDEESRVESQESRAGTEGSETASREVPSFPRRRESSVKESDEPDEWDDESPNDAPAPSGLLAEFLAKSARKEDPHALPKTKEPPPAETRPRYRPEFAHPTPTLSRLVMFRGVNPLYGVFLINQMGVADDRERIQALESVLELPRSIAYHVRVPPPDQLPPGPLAVTRLDPLLLRLGLAAPEELGAQSSDDERAGSVSDGPSDNRRPWEMPRVLTLSEKLRLLFDHEFPGVHDVRTQSVWAAGDVLEYGGDFNKYITSKGLQKQEGLIFRHLLRLILLLAEFAQIVPADTQPDEWRHTIDDLTRRLAECCHRVDPESTDKALEMAAAETDAP